MKRFSALLTILLLFALCVFADDGTQAKELLARARELSNFSSQDAKPFQLKASFRALGTQSGDLNGEYRLYWKSANEFRVEDRLSDFHETVVSEPKKSWRLSNLVMAPSQVSDVASMLAEFQKPGLDGLGHFSKLRSEKIGDLTAQCFDARNKNGKFNICFDSAAGTVLRVKKIAAGDTTVYRFSDYARAGAKLYPRKMTVERKGAMVVQAAVESMEEWTPTQGQLMPPAGAVSHAVCDLKEMKPPHGLSTPDPRWPDGALQNGTRQVVLRGLLTAQGQFITAEVLKSAGPEFDREAVRTVHLWKFEPARCGDQPTESQVNIELNFHDP